MHVPGSLIHGRLIAWRSKTEGVIPRNARDLSLLSVSTPPKIEARKITALVNATCIDVARIAISANETDENGTPDRHASRYCSLGL